MIAFGMLSWVFLAPGWGKHSRASPPAPCRGTQHGHTLVVFTLLPLLQLQPERSGSTLHSSPSRHGSIWHHHFCSTMEAAGEMALVARLWHGGHGTGGGCSGCWVASPAAFEGCKWAGGAMPLSITAHVCSDPASFDPTAPPASKAPGFLSLLRVKSLMTVLSSLPARAGSTVWFTDLLQAPLTEATGPFAATRLS